MATINYKGQNIDFSDLFFQYAKWKEGYRLSVYNDIKNLPTIGIGHLVTGNEPFTVVKGKTYSDAEIKQLFDMDYAKLHIEPFVEEIQAAGYSYNMMLAVAHFIWGHGYGQYTTSRLRAGLLQHSFDQASMFKYLKENWDIRSPIDSTGNKSGQRVNQEDFYVGFSSTPWEPGFSLPRQKV